MDATDPIEAAELARQTSDTAEEGQHVPTSKARGRLHARGPVGSLSVTSDIAVDQPVTDAEIRLILGAFGDTIAHMFDPSPAV